MMARGEKRRDLPLPDERLEEFNASLFAPSEEAKDGGRALAEEGITLIQSFLSIDDPDIRKSLLDFVQSLSKVIGRTPEILFTEK